MVDEIVDDLLSIAGQTAETSKKDDFMQFIRFCVARLNKDEPVQVIWAEWKRQETDK